jgi:hypothetical protein
VFGGLASVRVDGAVGKVWGWDKVDFKGEGGRMSGKVGLVEPGAAARKSMGLPGAAPGRLGQGNSWGCCGHPQKWCRGRRRW